MTSFFKKMSGGGERPNKVDATEIFWSWAGAFPGIALVALFNYNIFSGSDYVYIIGSFGASAVLLYGASGSPLAQPRNLLGGHILSAFIGVASFQLFHPLPWFAAAFAVATAIAVMHLTQTLHPPGGATALIAVTGSDKIHDLGFLYMLIPVALGAVTMLVIALVVNNMAKKRKYPVFWF